VARGGRRSGGARSRRSARRTDAAQRTAAPPPAAYAIGYLAYLGVLLLLYGPALEGPFVSDDIHYVAANDFVHGLTLENVGAILKPYGPATVAVVNYSPVQLLMHAAMWEWVGPETLGHHVLNLAFHALASLLLVPLLLSSGLSLGASVLASVFFLVHPANVEAVAWISQLKTSSALALGLGAVLAHPRRPGLGTALFALALLAKPNAAVVLPFAFWIEWARTGKLRVPWLGVWIGLFLAFALVEFTAHQRAGAAEATLIDSPLVLLRTIAGLATRYVALGATSIGVSAFHEPLAAHSWTDRWWLASLPVLGLLGWRFVVTLRRRSEEAGYWLFALFSFGPVSQIFPFLYPLADRYLYFILPGLLGGALLAGRSLLATQDGVRRVRFERAALGLAVATCVVFAVRTHDRAGIWRSPALILADAARNYPDGVSASLQRARAAAQRGDAEAAVAEIRRATARGYNRFEQLQSDPAFAAIRTTSVFRAVLREIAVTWVEAGRGWEEPTQGELRRLASAHAVLGERDAAVASLRSALERGGPLDDAIRADLRALGAMP